MTKQRANEIFDVLVKYAGASETLRDDFTFNHCLGADSCNEYRFYGSLGRGGKYYRERNKVNCYVEDETFIRVCTIDLTNHKLSEIVD